jgi:hypothetical protein
MPSTYTLISSTVLTSDNAGSLTISSIPATYTDLVLRFSARMNNASTSDFFVLQFNSIAGTSYSTTVMVGTGSAVSSSRISSDSSTFSGYSASADTATANTFGSGEIYIPNYAGSANKPISNFGVAETNASTLTYNIGVSAGLFSNSAAINSIKFLSYNGLGIRSGSSFYLYGIKNS